MYRAKLLDLDPPYQRNSVWNRSFKQFFIDTVLRNYPCPPIFINMEITESGATLYHVFDGKQRLLAILEFLDDRFPIAKEKYSFPNLAGNYFSQLDPDTQKRIYGYFLPFEFFTEVDEELLDSKHSTVRESKSLSPAQKAFLTLSREGKLLATPGDPWTLLGSRRYLITKEMIDLCPELKGLPIERRIDVSLRT